MHVVATAGHVDHGKSTLVRHLTGTDPDRLAEEKARGLTIDLGLRRRPQLPSGRRMAIIDVPGHVRFIKNMLAGVGRGRRLPVRGGGHRGLEAAVARSTCASSTCSASATAWSCSPRSASSTTTCASSRGSRSRSTWPARSSRAPRSSRSTRRPASGSTSCVPRSTAARRDADGRRPRPAPAVDRPQLRPRRRRHGGHRHARRRLGRARRRAGRRTRWANGPGTGHPAPQRTGDRARPGQPHGAQPRRRRPRRGRTGRRARTGAGSGTAPRSSTRRSPCSRRSTIRCRVGAPTWPTSGRASARRSCGSSAPDAIEPGETGAVRLHLDRAAAAAARRPLRAARRRSGRDGRWRRGPRRRAGAAGRRERVPDRSVDRVVAERGWVDVDRLALLTGERRTPTLGHWVVDPAASPTTGARLAALVDDAGPLGLDLATLDDRDRAVVETARRRRGRTAAWRPAPTPSTRSPATRGSPRSTPSRSRRRRRPTISAATRSASWSAAARWSRSTGWRSRRRPSTRAADVVRDLLAGTARRRHRRRDPRRARHVAQVRAAAAGPPRRDRPYAPSRRSADRRAASADAAGSDVSSDGSARSALRSFSLRPPQMPCCSRMRRA